MPAGGLLGVYAACIAQLPLQAWHNYNNIILHTVYLTLYYCGTEQILFYVVASYYWYVALLPVMPSSTY